MQEIIINNEVYILRKKEEIKAIDSNSGSWNTGYGNTGYGNTGNWNTADFNTGNCNSGNCNSGNCNSGNCNSGNWNTGDLNTGYGNTGNWNTGDFNTGYFNTNDPKIRIFNKETDVKRKDIKLPSFIYFNLTKYIYEKDMTAEEKQGNPIYKVTGGYLKSLKYKEAFRASWDNADIEDRKKILLVPNFNNEIFLEISGIDVAKELNLNMD